MFKNAATKLAHNSTLPSLGGNNDLRPLQDLITAEKIVLNSIQKLASDLGKASDALRTWGLGEGDDLGDTLSASATVIGHFSNALLQYASLHNTVRDNMKAVRTREEALDELKRRRRRIAANAESAERKLNKMSPEHKNLVQQTEMLNRLREEIRGLDTEILAEEADVGDYKRKCTKNWMTLKFGGLVECCEKGVIIGNIGKNILVDIPEEQTQPGMPRAFYNGHTHVNFLLADCTNRLKEVQFSGVPSSRPEGPFSDGNNAPESPHSPGIPGQSPYGTQAIGGGSGYAPYQAGHSVTTVTNPNSSVDEMGVSMGPGGGPSSMSALPRHGPAPSITTQSQFNTMPTRGPRGPGGFYDSNTNTPTSGSAAGSAFGAGGPRPSLGDRPPQAEGDSFSHSVAEALSLRGDQNTASTLARNATGASLAHDEPAPQYEPYDASAPTGGIGGGGGGPYDGLPPGAAPAAVPAWGHGHTRSIGQGVSLADGSGSPQVSESPTREWARDEDGLPRHASRHVVFGQAEEDDQQAQTSQLSSIPPRSSSLVTEKGVPAQGREQEQPDAETSSRPTSRDERRLSRVPPPSSSTGQEYAPPPSRRQSTVPPIQSPNPNHNLAQPPQSHSRNQSRNTSPLPSPRPPSVLDDEGLMKTLNAEAARSIAEEIDALSSEPPPSVLRARPRAGSASVSAGGGRRSSVSEAAASPPMSPTSPLAPPSAPYAQRAVSPGNDASGGGGGGGGAPAGGRPLPNPSPLASPLSASPKLGTLPSFSLQGSTPSTSPYRTPPEYPAPPSRPFGASSPYTRSTSSLTSLTSGPGGAGAAGAGGMKTISAAAFRRPQARMPSGSEAPLPGVPPPSGGGGGGSPGAVHQQYATSPSPADTSPLALRGKSSGHMRQHGGGGGGGGSSVGGIGSQAFGGLPPGASPGAGPGGRPLSGAANEDDFDYISAYVNGQENGGQHQGQGYDQGRFATNLEEDNVR
ncbi:hypothetical protein CONPUDRAFT_131737 [Coniophora puteana RWD-64-598 SS2]|uniref:Uncharacterized protein n=1 Tax=Coniophora puteana (strain RWD-64-598) TaxID=741705 RepID=A0A5M3M8J9_CONPW|nr:uncharacterized protein CONPUDRAFT_131737 [Coniophora puteana RWD-64-598 SS2]EIW75499.1 hypothetical protein CONPUDRAFT_131737 [Coniophora puteana RWD-64-598 SS2]